jgi:hypothetical protein
VRRRELPCPGRGRQNSLEEGEECKRRLESGSSIPRPDKRMGEAQARNSATTLSAEVLNRLIGVELGNVYYYVDLWNPARRKPVEIFSSYLDLVKESNPAKTANLEVVVSNGNQLQHGPSLHLLFAIIEPEVFAAAPQFGLVAVMARNEMARLPGGNDEKA